MKEEGTGREKWRKERSFVPPRFWKLPRSLGYPCIPLAETRNALYTNSISIKHIYATTSRVVTWAYIGTMYRPTLRYVHAGMKVDNSTDVVRRRQTTSRRLKPMVMPRNRPAVTANHRPGHTRTHAHPHLQKILQLSYV